MEDANRQNKRYGQEIKLLKTQLSSLQQKNSMGQQLIDSLKKELFSLRDEKSKLQDELVFIYFYTNRKIPYSKHIKRTLRNEKFPFGIPPLCKLPKKIFF